MPDWNTHLRARLQGLQLSAAREAEIVEELSQHLDERYEERRTRGATESEAARAALQELHEPGALADHMRSLRQARTLPPIQPGAPRRFLLGDLRQDVRYAARMLRKQPAFAAAAVLTLALGIGANSAIFALVDATLLRPLPLPAAERVVMLWERTETSPRDRVSPLNLADWAARSRTFDAIGGFVPNIGSMVMNGADGTAETVPRQWVTAGIFDALGVKAIAGRTFHPADDRERASVVVIGEAFWHARFNRDPSIVGRTFRLDGEPYTIVGVVPKEAEIIGRTSMWGLVSFTGAPPRARGSHLLHTIGRLKPEVTREAAEADMAAVASALAAEFPATNAGRGITLQPLDEAVIGSDLRQTSLLFLGVVGFVLLVCCVNVANLLLTRATVRRRELAIRSALGADRARVIRQLLTESTVLSAIGGLLGIGIGAAILSVAPSMLPEDLFPAGMSLALDARVVGFCAATALLAGLVFGLAPAWQATEWSPTQAIDGGSRTTSGRGGRLRGLLVAAEVATAVVLLVGAGLLLRALLEVENVERGYRAESVLTMMVDPLGSLYPTDAAQLQFYQAVEQEVTAVPGVRSVGWASTLPLGESYAGQAVFQIVGEPPIDERTQPTADYQIVSPTYFPTVDLPVVAGRAFTDADTADGVAVCIVNEAFARRYAQGRSPIGLRVAMRPADAAQAPAVVREVVGVARQVKGRPDEIEDLVQIYVPLAQEVVGDIFMLVAAASGGASALTPSVRAAIGRIDKEQLVSIRDVMTLEDVVWDATARYRFRATLVTTFAALALVLAMVGVFGVLAYSVEQRVRDVGVRRALGASTADVLRLVVGSALRMIAAGALVGAALALALGRLLEAMLFRVQALDPTTFLSVAVVLAVTAAVSIAGPAWRAARIDPAVALRME